MPVSQPPLPTPEQLLFARYIAGNPARFIHDPDFTFLINNAWWALKADQEERIRARKAAEAIRATFPEDAA